MARINLLPWREERRKLRNREAQTLFAATAFGAVMAVLLIVFQYGRVIDAQLVRNQILQDEIKIVDGKIKEVEEFEKERSRLLSRKQIIEQLQSSRSVMVHLFDDLVRTLPEGVRLSSIKQAGDQLTMEGSAESNARVSEYMRKIEASQWMGNPDLAIVEAKGADKRSRYVFILRVTLKRPKIEGEEGAETDADPALADVPGEGAAMKLSEFDLKDIDFQRMGSWPTPVKAVFAALIFILIVGVGWWFYVQPKREALAGHEAKEQELLDQFRFKQSKVVNLAELKRQLEEMKELLRQMLRQLPSKTEMPDLLVDVSQTALSTGIDNQKFEPGPEIIKEFYAEKPINLRMVGTYHQFGSFVSGVASLPRVVILTMHDISLKPQETAAARGAGARPMASGNLVLEGTVRTYRYVDEDEAAEVAAANDPDAAAKGK